MDNHLSHLLFFATMVFFLTFLPLVAVMGGDWQESFMISDSVRVVGSPEVMNNFAADADTSWVVWTGQTADSTTDIFLTKLWNQDFSLQYSTIQLSRSTGHAYSPTLTSLEYFRLSGEMTPVVAWLHSQEDADSVDILWRRRVHTEWTEVDTLIKIPRIPWIFLYPGLGIWAQEEIVLIYPGRRLQHLYQFRFDTDDPAPLPTDTLLISHNDLQVDSLQDFHLVTFFDHDMFSNYSIGRIKSGGYWHQIYDRTLLRNGESWEIFIRRENVTAIDVAQGYSETPSMGWVERNDSTNAELIGLLESRKYTYPTLPTYSTGWKKDASFFPFDPGADVRGISVRNVDTTRTFLAWDAGIENNREIFFRVSPSDSTAERVTAHSGTDTNPAVTHLPVKDDSMQAIVLWVSDRSGENRLWMTTSKVPVAVQAETMVPQQLSVSQNYPNPFNATTAIEYEVPQAGDISIDIFDLRGQRILSIARQAAAPGTYTYQWEGDDSQGSAVSSGLYFIRVRFKSEAINMHVERVVRAVVVK